MRLEIKYNNDFTQATYILQGDGTYIVDILEGSPTDIVSQFVAIIVDYSPKYIVFSKAINHDLVKKLQIKNIFVDTVNNSVVYI